MHVCLATVLLDMQDSQEQSLCLEKFPFERLLLRRDVTALSMGEQLLSA